MVRSTDNIPIESSSLENLSVIHASILALSDAELVQYVGGCDALISCLGHSLTSKGLFEHPRRLVTDATKKRCLAIKATKPKEPVKFVLMNTTGNRNRDAQEQISFG